MATHRHRCGLTARGFDPSKGCGHIWEHPDPDGTESPEVYAARHVCPACGRPDQRWRMDGHDDEDKALELIAAILRRIVEREKQEHERLFKRRT